MAGRRGAWRRNGEGLHSCHAAPRCRLRAGTRARSTATARRTWATRGRPRGGALRERPDCAQYGARFRDATHPGWRSPRGPRGPRHRTVACRPCRHSSAPGCAGLIPSAPRFHSYNHATFGPHSRDAPRRLSAEAVSRTRKPKARNNARYSPSERTAPAATVGTILTSCGNRFRTASSLTPEPRFRYRRVWLIVSAFLQVSAAIPSARTSDARTSQAWQTLPPSTSRSGRRLSSTRRVCRRG